MESLKAFVKLIVILKIILVYCPLLFLMTWFNWYFVTHLFEMNFLLLFSVLYKWYQYLGFIILEWVYISVTFGLIYGLIKVITKNKDFFLS